ncbi:MAG TPA: ABC transporter permease [Alphaproteobacteria bacterium]|nr:ABC transporter permease [Alphaproteobacteria bacterium]
MRRRLDGPRFGALGAYTLLYLGFVYLPPALLPLFSFNDSIYIAFPLQGFTLRWYEEMINNPALVQAFENTLKVGGVVALVATVLGTLAAKAVTRYRVRGQKPLLAVIMLPLVIPEIVLGISLLTSINRLDLPLSLVTIALGHTVICMPFAMLVMISRMEGFDASVEEAALDLGENPWMVFWRVTFPLIFPGVLASLLLTFTISFDEFILAFFLAGDQVTLPIYIWSQLRFPQKLPQVLALGAAILLASFVLVSLAEVIRRRGVQLPSRSGV